MAPSSFLGSDGLFNGSAPPGVQHGVPTHAHYDIASDHGRDGRARRVVFDRKVAQQSTNLYDPIHQERWRDTVRNYLIGERWEMKALLDWAEAWQKQEIPEAEIRNLHGHSAMSDVGFDPVQANHELWAFLNLNLPASATKVRNLFKKAKELQGFDVWRRIVVPMAPKTISRRIDMHGDVHNPAAAKKLGDVMDVIDDWERLHEKYQEMGGMPIPPAEQCVIIMRMLHTIFLGDAARGVPRR